MQEDTRLDPKHQDQAMFLDSAKPWENVRFRGEDIKRGTTIAETGQLLSAAQLGALAACGIADVKAACRPSVALLATGSELREAGNPLRPEPGRIYESNRAALAPLVESAGGHAVVFPIVPDEPNATRAALARAFEQCHIVVTCGGVSVGEMDFVKSSFEELGGTLEFWKVAIKPGRPFVFGRFRKQVPLRIAGQSRVHVRDFSAARPAGFVALAGCVANRIALQSRRPVRTVLQSREPPALRASAHGCGGKRAFLPERRFAHSRVLWRRPTACWIYRQMRFWLSGRLSAYGDGRISFNSGSGNSSEFPHRILELVMDWRGGVHRGRRRCCGRVQIRLAG